MSTELPRRQRPTGTRAKICIVASEYNEQYTQALVDNCSEELAAVLPSARLEVVRVPGAFEIPVTIKSILSRSPEKRPDAVVALGVILRGSTDHADLIGSTITQALMQLALEFTTPVIHEVLLLNDEKQAFARCIASQLNRGREAARTAARMAELFINSLARQEATPSRPIFLPPSCSHATKSDKQPFNTSTAPPNPRKSPENRKKASGTS